jgi:cytochrome c oxidase subunit 4
MMDTHSMNPAPATPAAHGGGDPGGHEGAHAPSPYFKVWFVLLVFTVLEVIVGVAAWPLVVKAPLLVGMALFKAVLVAAYFMHLKFEKKLLWVVASAPLIFGVILAIGAYPDSEHSTDAKKHGQLPERSESR